METCVEVALNWELVENGKYQRLQDSCKRLIARLHETRSELKPVWNLKPL